MDNEINFLPEDERVKIQKSKKDNNADIEWTEPALKVDDIDKQEKAKEPKWSFSSMFAKKESNENAKKPKFEEIKETARIPAKREVKPSPPAKPAIEKFEVEEIKSKMPAAEPEIEAPKAKKKKYSGNVFAFLFGGLKRGKKEIIMSESSVLGKDKESRPDLLSNKTVKNAKPSLDRLNASANKPDLKKDEVTGEDVASNIFGTNLMKNSAFEFFNWKRLALEFSFYLLSGVLVVLILYGGLLIWEKQLIKGSDMTGKISELNKEIASLQNTIARDNIEESEAKLPIVEFLLKNHIYWTNFFNFLEKNTLATVKYDGFKGNTSGNYALTAYTGDLLSIDRQLVQFRESRSVVSNASIGGIGIGDTKNPGEKNIATSSLSAAETAKQKIKFSLYLDIIPGLFRAWKGQ